jgi:hypothetical protein
MPYLKRDSLSLLCAEEIIKPLSQKRMLNERLKSMKCEKCFKEIDPFLFPAGFTSAKWRATYGDSFALCKDCAEMGVKIEAETDINGRLLRKFKEKVEKTIPKRFLSSDISSEGSQEIKDYFLSEKWREGRGLFICGSPGIGKSRMLSGLAKLFIVDDRDIMFCNMTFLLNKLKQSYGNDSAKEDIAEKSIAAEILLLDDLGIDKATEWMIATLYFIINQRYEEMKTTIISSNFNLQELEGKVGERITSRIFEMCQSVTLNGKNKRVKK